MSDRAYIRALFAAGFQPLGSAWTHPDGSVIYRDNYRGFRVRRGSAGTINRARTRAAVLAFFQAVDA